jgi:hypothetical protein
MSKQRSSKWVVEAAKRERAQMKQERKAAGRSDGTDDGGGTQGNVDQAGVMASLAALHERFEAGGIGFDEFEEAKAALLARLAG